MPNFDSVSASSLGRIRSDPRTIVDVRGVVRRYQLKILAQQVSNVGYPFVKISRMGVVKTCTVHSLVLAAFVGPRPHGFEACHANGDRMDARACNLRWDSRAGNAADKLRHGTHNRGERCGISKLTADDVRAIRLDKRPHREIAKQYGIAGPTVSNVQTGASWAHVHAELIRPPRGRVA